MKLTDLLTDIPIVSTTGPVDVDIRGLAYSSKSVTPGFLFAALKGQLTDGSRFVGEAVDKGAAAVLSEKSPPEGFPLTWIQVSEARKALAWCSANFYGRASKELQVIGITGTKGKTTITYLLESILKEAHRYPAVIGTIAYRGPKMDHPAERTTPESPDLQRMLRSLKDQGATHCLMEVSSHSLDLDRVEAIEFDVAVFTNLSGEHLDYHPSMEDYFEAKKRLFLPGEKKKMAVINADDTWGKRLIDEVSVGTITYGMEPPSHIFVEEFRLSHDGIQAEIRFPAGKLEVSSPLVGKPNLYNILASVAAVLTLNIPVRSISKGIRALKGVPGRFEKIENDKGLNIFVDYAHTDDALRKLLQTARDLSHKRVIVVFGAGGDRDKSKRPRMGRAAGELADWSILTSDNPRSEYPMAIISDIEKGLKAADSKKYEIQPNRREAIKKALALAEEGDYVLIAGKGHEGYQIIRDKILPFNDAEVIRSLLEEEEAG